MAWREQLEVGELTIGSLSFRETSAAEQVAIFDLPTGIAGKVIETGDYSSTAGNAVELDSSNTRPNSFLGDDGGSAATGNIRNLLSRVLVTANHTGALTLEAIRGQVKFADGVDYDADYAAGVCGYLEIAGATDFNLNNDDHSACALRARVEAAGNVSVEQGYLTGLYIELNTTGAYTFTTDSDGILAGIVITKTDQKNDAWDDGIYIASDAADEGVVVEDCTTAFKTLGTQTYGINIRDGAAKIHCHDRSTQSYAMEVKYDWQATTGLAFGIDCTCEIEPGGGTPANRTSGGLRAVQGVARIGSGFTATGGTDIGVYGQFCNNGTLNGSTYPTAMYGLIEDGGTWTQVSVLSVAWLDSHLAQTISAGDAYFLNITNNAATTVWTAAIHVYGGNNITNFVKIDTASGMVGSNTAGDATFANWKPIKVDLDGTTHYLIAAQTIS